VQRGAKGAFAYVVGAENTVAARNLVLGPANGEVVVVENGLREGERVVTLGADRLRDGASVTVPETARKDEAKPKAESTPGDAPKKREGGKRDEKS
jgi:multidrug efflux system membrane fusion protein